MPRVRSQLAIQAPPELLERVRAAAAARGQTVTHLLVGWIEAGLSGEPSGGDASGLAASLEALRGDVELGSVRLSRCMNGQAQLLQRLGALEQAAADGPDLAALTDRVARLEAEQAHRRRPNSLQQVSPKPPLERAPIPQMGDASDGAITTAELAERIGMKRGSLNERIRRAGGARLGLLMEGWRCVGQGPGHNGGPPRWLWEQA